METLFYVEQRPRVPSSFLAPLRAGVQVPDREGGPKTEYGRVGEGLKYAPVPYNPSSNTMPPPRFPPASDPDAPFSQGEADSVAVLVTHGDGRQSVERLVRDRFMPLPNRAEEVEAEVLVRLHRAGITTAVGATLNAF